MVSEEKTFEECVERGHLFYIDSYKETRRHKPLIFGFWLHPADLYQDCSNYSPRIKIALSQVSVVLHRL